MNVTNNDWPLKATVVGTGFSGPSTLLAKAFMTTKFPLVFKPLREEEITVSTTNTHRHTCTHTHLYVHTHIYTRLITKYEIEQLCHMLSEDHFC